MQKFQWCPEIYREKCKSSSEPGDSDSQVIIIIIIIIKKVGSARLTEIYTPYQSKDISPTIPTYRETEERGKKSRRL